MKTGFSYTNSYNGVMNVCFFVCKLVPTSFFWGVCLTLSFLSKLKFTMYRWTNILLLTTRSEQNQHSYCRLLTATESEDQVVRSLLSAVVVVVAPHFTESSLSSSSRLFFYHLHVLLANTLKTVLCWSKRRPLHGSGHFDGLNIRSHLPAGNISISPTGYELNQSFKSSPL